MKFVIFSPTGATSPIARTNAAVVEVLEERGHQVHVVASDTTPVSGRHPGLVDAGNAHDAARLESMCERADLTLHHVSNELSSITGSIAALPFVGGVVHLHDAYLGRAFAQYLRSRTRLTGKGKPDPFRPVHGLLGGVMTVLAHERMEQHPSFYSAGELFLQWITRDAGALIVSDPTLVDRIERDMEVSTRHIPFPVVPGPDSPRPPVPDHGGRRHVVTVAGRGDVDYLQAGILALSSDRRVRQSVAWTITGAVEADRRRALVELASTLGVALRFTDFPGADPSAAAIVDADCLLVLRSPETRLYGDDVVAALRAGVPVIRPDAGGATPWPEDVVLRVTGLDLQEALTDFYASWISGRRSLADVAARGQEFVAGKFEPASYADALEALAAESIGGMRAELNQVFAPMLRWTNNADPANPSSEFARAMRIFW